MSASRPTVVQYHRYTQADPAATMPQLIRILKDQAATAASA